MAAAPRLKVYSEDNEYLASCHYPEDAAAIIALRAGGTIRDGHGKKDVVWEEGTEDQPAGESYDFVASVVNERLHERAREAWNRISGKGRE